MSYKLLPNECADLTQDGDRHFHAKPPVPTELERLRAENLRLTSDFGVAMAEKQLALREVARLRQKLAVLTEALEKCGLTSAIRED